MNEIVLNRKCYKCSVLRPLNDRNFAPAPVPTVYNSGFTWGCLACLDRDALVESGFGIELINVKGEK